MAQYARLPLLGILLVFVFVFLHMSGAARDAGGGGGAAGSVGGDGDEYLSDEELGGSVGSDRPQPFLLSPVTEEDIGITADELQEAFTAKPPAVLKPEHANRLRNIRDPHLESPSPCTSTPATPSHGGPGDNDADKPGGGGGSGGGGGGAAGGGGGGSSGGGNPAFPHNASSSSFLSVGSSSAAAARKAPSKAQEKAQKQLQAALGMAADRVRQEWVDLFLRCYTCRDLAREGAAPLRALEEFVFSVPDTVAEAHQKAALDQYTEELLAAMARKKHASKGGYAHYAPLSDAPLEKLRLHLSIVVETNTALHKELKKKHHVYPLAVSPVHHHTEHLPASCSGAEHRLFKEFSVRNPGSRAYRYWIHSDLSGSDLPPPQRAAAAAAAVAAASNASAASLPSSTNSLTRSSDRDQRDRGYDFHVLSHSSGELKKRETQPIHLSLIVGRRKARSGARELVCLESEFGFRHFLSVQVVRHAGCLGRTLGQCGVVEDCGFYVPTAAKRLREALVASGGLGTRDVFGVSALHRPSLPADWRLLIDDAARLRKCADPRLHACLLLRYLKAVAGPAGCFGPMRLDLAQREVDAAAPLLFVSRPSQPFASAQLSAWFLALLCEVLAHSRHNGSRPRLLAAAVASSTFSFPDEATTTTLDAILLHQHAAQLLNMLLTNFYKVWCAQ
eukprot:Rhum_TRINITY_DN14441_c5_g1::Rhum_TRINITY_DN14441_c5_g1_i1::g.89286::m.89286